MEIVDLIARVDLNAFYVTLKRLAGSDKSNRSRIALQTVQHAYGVNELVGYFLQESLIGTCKIRPTLLPSKYHGRLFTYTSTSSNALLPRSVLRTTILTAMSMSVRISSDGG